MSEQSITLFYQNELERSDKVYSLQIEKQGDGYIVNAQWGRRGGTMQVGSKTASPVPLADAEKIYNRLVASKRAEGYQPGTTAAAPVATTATQNGRTPFGIEVLEEIATENEALAYLKSPKYFLQLKCDGHYCQIQKLADGSYRRFNKLGGSVAGIPAEVVADLKKFKASTFFMCGELIGNSYIVFDLYELDGHSFANESYTHRFNELEGLVLSTSRFVTVVATWRTLREKVLGMKALRDNRCEGAVFKLAAATYRGGDSGHHFKFKFVKSLSAVVVRKGDKGHNSATIGLYDKDRCMIEVGHCSLNGKETVNVGQVLEIHYLYGSADKRLVQARMKGIRDDVPPAKCTLDQIIFKEGVA
jgi:bifunctional non-homologous end joining protein LigD